VTIRRVEAQLTESLSALKGIALQLVEFAIFMYGLAKILVHALK
jgi:hypothetical protein